MPQPNDFLVKSQQKQALESKDATYAYFGPVETTDRFRFLVVREAGDLISVQPSSEGRFKTGLKALRWSEAKGGESTTYIVVKTRPNRIDLRRI